MKENEKIEGLAAQWVAREDRGLTSGESEALSSWLEKSTAHRLAYLRLKTSWEGSARLAVLRNSPRFADHSRANLSLMRLAAIAAAILVIVGAGTGAAFYFWLQPAPPTIYEAKAGQRPTLRLPDGTKIQLNANSRVRTSMTRQSRIVILERGEAYFQVVHNGNRPFVVVAGNHRITDLGTKFSVRRDGDEIRVVVTEGRVRVDVENTPLPMAPVYAGSGNVVDAKADETLVASKSPQQIFNELEWRNGMIVLNQKTLAQAAEEFNRYNRKKIIVTGVARDISIGGNFRADNIAVFALLVHNALGLTVTDDPNNIVISK